MKLSYKVQRANTALIGLGYHFLSFPLLGQTVSSVTGAGRAAVPFELSSPRRQSALEFFLEDFGQRKVSG